MMGTHGHEPLTALMGSVAEKIVGSAPCPVLTIRHPAARRRRPRLAGRWAACLREPIHSRCSAASVPRLGFAAGIMRFNFIRRLRKVESIAAFLEKQSMVKGPSGPLLEGRPARRGDGAVTANPPQTARGNNEANGTKEES